MIVQTLLALAVAQAPASVRIDNFAGEIEIVEGASLSAETIRPGAHAAPQITGQDGVLLIDGGIEPRRWRCHGGRFIHTDDTMRVGPSRREAVQFEELARVRITVPEGTSLVIEDSIIRGSSGDLGSLDLSADHCGSFQAGAIGGQARIALSGSMDVTTAHITGAADIETSASGDVRIGDAASLSAALSGSGDVAAGDVAGPIEASLSASGDFSAGSATQADVSASGSGDVTLGSVAGRLAARLSASGDLEAGDAGVLDAVTTGSGDIGIGDAPGGISFRSGASGSLNAGDAGGVNATLNGSGGAYLDSVNGAVRLVLSASGDIEIDAGRADPFSVRSSGSGDVEFAGTAVSPQVTMTAGGDVVVGQVEGSSHVQSNGSGTFRSRD